MKKPTIKLAVSLFLVIVVPLIFSCDTKSNKDPMLIINVNISQPVDETRKLYAFFYVSFLPPWSAPWLTLSSSSKQIITPKLSIGTIPLFMEILYDADGSGTVSTGDLYQGWYGKISRTADPLDPVVLPDVELMILDVNLDGASFHGVIP